MNAKKIMGAVLVALLALTAFAGAGAAASYFAYQETTDDINGVWQKGADTVTVTGGVVGAVPSAGTYTLVGDSNKKHYFTTPTATYSAIGNLSGIEYIVANGANVYKGSNLTIEVASLVAAIAVDNISVTDPNGGINYYSADKYAAGDEKFDTVGTYKIQAIWNNKSNFTTGAPIPVFDATVFTFTVVDADAATISASVDTVFAGDVIAVTIKGTPGEYYNLTLTEINAANQLANQVIKLNNNGASDLYFQMPNIGEVTLRLTVDNDAKDEAKVMLKHKSDELGEIVIAVAKPALTVTLDAASYFVGNEIELTLTSDVALKNEYNFTISGTNFKETLAGADYDHTEGKSVIYTIKTANIKEAATAGGAVDNAGKALDVGTYSIKIYKGNVEVGTDGKVKTNNLVKTVSVSLKQPFISITEAPEVVVQDKKAEFIINAEATGAIQAYVFGTNYFTPYYKDAGVVKDSKIANKFTVTIPAAETKNMSAGQYFMVFQHPMYDTEFNINATETGDFYLNTSETATDGPGNTFLFSANSRQTANAAQALCDALDSQNIDDMYVKYSFFVVGKDAAFTISEIPTEVAQGDKIVISGVSTANAEDAVIVEMISTAFAAVPKETVGSAAFITVTTEVAEDGTWEITLDTSDLNVDEYSLSVVCEDQTWKTVTINVVEAGDEPVTPEQPEQPEQPENPEEPVAPATPGFGALAALAGLGAVAVLLLRRE